MKHLDTSKINYRGIIERAHQFDKFYHSQLKEKRREKLEKDRQCNCRVK